MDRRPEVICVREATQVRQADPQAALEVQFDLEFDPGRALVGQEVRVGGEFSNTMLEGMT